jgi:hypothetical protein
LKYSCESARKIICPNGLVVGGHLSVEANSLKELTGIKDIHRLDRELDHLRSLELIGSSLGGGFSPGKDLIAEIGPTALALNLYVKTQGHNSSPDIYWKETIIKVE